MSQPNVVKCIIVFDTIVLTQFLASNKQKNNCIINR